MKRIGILGGMSPESTVIYYRALNEGARHALGPLATADCLIASVNFAQIQTWQKQGNWEAAGNFLAERALGLERAGADIILLATNTMHKCAASIEAALSVPFLHIADATAACLKRDGRRRPLLLGTAYTMEQDFYKGRLRDRHGIDIVIPDDTERAMVHAAIFDELVNGTITEKSQAAFVNLVAQYAANGADSVILGCTEIGMLLDEQNAPLPPYDTARLHCEEALRLALA